MVKTGTTRIKHKGWEEYNWYFTIQTSRKKIIQHRWIKPNDDFIPLNYDAGFKDNIGAIIL